MLVIIVIIIIQKWFTINHFYAPDHTIAVVVVFGLLGKLYNYKIGVVKAGSNK